MRHARPTFGTAVSARSHCTTPSNSPEGRTFVRLSDLGYGEHCFEARSRPTTNNLHCA
jgi:hypothetical protein